MSDNTIVRRMRLILATKMARMIRNIFLVKKRTYNEYKNEFINCNEYKNEIIN